MEKYVYKHNYYDNYITVEVKGFSLKVIMFGREHEYPAFILDEVFELLEKDHHYIGNEVLEVSV